MLILRKVIFAGNLRLVHGHFAEDIFELGLYRGQFGDIPIVFDAEIKYGFGRIFTLFTLYQELVFVCTRLPGH